MKPKRPALPNEASEGALAPEAAALLDVVRSSGKPPLHELSVEAARLSYDQSRAAMMPAAREPVDGVADIDVAGPAGPIAVRRYRPAGADGGRPLPLIVYYHGGGWVLGGLDAFDSLCRKLANRSGCLLYSVDYRLAPEHAFPAQIDDGWAALVAIAARAAADGGDPDRLAVAGDSAGATIAAVVALLARDRGGVAIGYQALFYPVTDAALDSASHRTFADGHILTRDALLWFQNHYLGVDGDRTDWRHSPLRTPSLAGLPPAFVITASHDPLCDEGEAYARRLAASGNKVTLTRAEGQLHGFLAMDGYMTAADPMIDQAGAAIRAGLGFSEAETAAPARSPAQPPDPA